MSIWWSLHLRREAASVPLARRLLMGTMETAGVDPEISYDLSLALSEACANAVEHGGTAAPGEPGGPDGESPAAYRVTAYLDGETCRIEVADTGPGFARPRGRIRSPQVSPDAESGRGLGLIEELADHVRIRNRPGRAGAVVSFDKMLKWREGAPLVVT
ncbi:ATP-binding protein [Streptomyces sp. NPDC060194]|uniref:ATP-binding protein n=1 Tax=Streptomyces sp. NPDC060194 TaxID=3347069 RepID=UPI0036533D19